jgi:hypothetical protein
MDLYKEYIKGVAGAEMVLNYIKETSGDKNFMEGTDGAALEAFLVYGQRYRDNKDYTADYQRIVNDEKTSRVQRDRASQIMSILDSLKWDNDILSYLTNKIEIAERFTSS